MGFFIVVTFSTRVVRVFSSLSPSFLLLQFSHLRCCPFFHRTTSHPASPKTPGMGAPGFVTLTLAPTTSKKGEEEEEEEDNDDDDGGVVAPSLSPPSPSPAPPPSSRSASAIRAASVSTSCARGPSATTARATAWILL